MRLPWFVSFKGYHVNYNRKRNLRIKETVFIKCPVVKISLVKVVWTKYMTRLRIKLTSTSWVYYFLMTDIPISRMKCHTSWRNFFSGEVINTYTTRNITVKSELDVVVKPLLVIFI